MSAEPTSEAFARFAVANAKLSRLYKYQKVTFALGFVLLATARAYVPASRIILSFARHSPY